MFSWRLVAGVVVVVFHTVSTVSAAAVTLCGAGQQPLPIRIAKDASPELESLAEELRQRLSIMGKCEFRVERNLIGSGLVLQVQHAATPSLMQREDYSIRSDGQRVVLAGATETAVQHAAWDLMYRLGYRQFFPGITWEVLPDLSEIRIDISIDESPDYRFRRIWYGYGVLDDNKQAYLDWCRRNRMGGGLELRTGHAYGAIIRAQQATFDQHPEFYALIDGKRDVRPQAKLCIGNPELRATVVQYARDYFREHPEEDCISVDPSDGGGWCECDLCQKIGSPSDLALTVANEVAQAVHPRLVGMYAYNYHSEPPRLPVQSNVVINAATAFIKGGRSIDDVIQGWSDKGATVGIREYYSVHTWDRDLPGEARGSHLKYLAETIPAFHAAGARFLSAESSDNWGCNGLGYYFASRVLWDLDQARQKQAVIDDFLSKAFGPAEPSMRRFYTLIDGQNEAARLVFDDQLGRMYRQLQDAVQAVPAESAYRDRIDHLILYTRSADLFDRYRAAEGANRQAAFETWIRHLWRMRESMMVHVKAAYRDVAARDKTLKIPPEAAWNVPTSENPWKSEASFSDSEIAQMLVEGVRSRQPTELDFAPRKFSDELQPVAQLIPDLPPASSDVPLKASVGRGERSWWTVLHAPGELVLHIKGGMIAHYRDRGNVAVTVTRIGGASESGEQQTLVAEDNSVVPDGIQRTIRFSLTDPGLYRIDVNDGHDMTEVTWPTGQRMTWKLSLQDHPAAFSGRWSLWFYVPQNTRVLGLYADTSAGEVLDPSGQVVVSLKDRKGQFLSVPVAPGTDGRLWRFSSLAGKACLLNVPVTSARSPDELLLPIDAEAEKP